MTDPPLSACQLLLLYTRSPFVPGALNQTRPINKLHKRPRHQTVRLMAIPSIQIIYGRVTWPRLFRQTCGVRDNTWSTRRRENDTDNGVFRPLSSARPIKLLQRRNSGGIKHSGTHTFHLSIRAGNASLTLFHYLHFFYFHQNASQVISMAYYRWWFVNDTSSACYSALWEDMMVI